MFCSLTQIWSTCVRLFFSPSTLLSAGLNRVQTHKSIHFLGACNIQFTGRLSFPFDDPVTFLLALRGQLYTHTRQIVKSNRQAVKFAELLFPAV